MNLLEHEAKTILSSAHITTPLSTLISKDTPASITDFPVVLKSQVPVGGRGKAGGIIIAQTPEELVNATEKIFNLEIKGHKPTSILAEEKLTISRELYLSLLVDRAEASLKLIAHTQGGVEVEDNKEFASWPLDYTKPDFDALGQALADYYDLPEKTFVLQDLVQNLITCFKQHDATLLEINPPGSYHGGDLVAGDCKMVLDDAAAFRHPQWNFEATIQSVNFVTINPHGNVATIANGAGLAMATVDAVYDAGLVPANFLDIGGGATAEVLVTAFKQLREYVNVQAIIINVFGGITQADEVARAIVEAKKSIAELPPLFIRLSGTNGDEAKAVLEAHQIAILPNLEACLLTAKEMIDA